MEIFKYENKDEYYEDKNGVANKIDPSKIDKNANITIIKNENEQQKEPIPTKEGEVFEREGRFYAVHNGAMVRATKEEIDQYFKNLKKQNKEN